MNKSHNLLIIMVVMAAIILLIAGFYLDANDGYRDIDHLRPASVTENVVIWSSKELDAKYENGKSYLEFTGCMRVSPPFTVTQSLSQTLSNPYVFVCVK